MPTPSNPNLIAQALGTGVDPLIRKKLGELLAQGAASAAAVPASGVPEAVDVLQNPGATPAAYNGNMGRSLLEDPRPAASPQEPAKAKVKGFEDTAGGKMAMSLLEKRKNLKWWMPDQFANRNERDMAQAIDLARAEMGGTEGQDVSAQRWANLLNDKQRTEAAQTEHQSRLSESRAAAEARAKEHADGLALQRDQLAETTRYHNLIDTDRDAAQGYRERVRNATKGAGVPNGKPLYDVTAEDPGATGVFANYAAKLLKDNPMIDPQDVPAEQVKASRLGILPKMMSRPSDRPAGAAGPAAGAALNTVFQRDPRTGKLVRVR